MKGNGGTSEDKASRQTRKEEAKKLKRKRIEEAGGMRPRKPQSSSSNSNANSNKPHQSQTPPNSKKNRSKVRQKPRHTQRAAPTNSSHNSTHRFGRVMEQPPCPLRPRLSTLTIAVPGSVVSNAQTHELRTRLVGQIARAAAVFHVDEVVVFDDHLSDKLRVRPRWGRDAGRDSHRGGPSRGDGAGAGGGEDRQQPAGVASSDPHAFMANILQYCECPQYLRKNFFPVHPDLQFAGLLPPIDAPHHVRMLDRTPYREGVVLDKKVTDVSSAAVDGTTTTTDYSLVNCGIRDRDIQIDKSLPPGIRCTVQISPKAYTTPGKKMRGTVVSPSQPRQQNGTYWGYTTRIAPSLGAIFDQCPYPNGYDVKIGTSERGDITVDDADFHTHFAPYISGGASDGSENGTNDNPTNADAGAATDTDAAGTTDKTEQSFQHAIIVFGGVAGIEECVDADETLTVPGSESRSLFDLWVNICPYQGSRTIRTEEAVWLSLARLRPHLFPVDRKRSEKDTTTARTTATTTTTTNTPQPPPPSESSAHEMKTTNAVVKQAPVAFSDSAPSEESSDEDED